MEAHPCVIVLLKFNSHCLWVYWLNTGKQLSKARGKERQVVFVNTKNHTSANRLIKMAEIPVSFYHQHLM